MASTNTNTNPNPKTQVATVFGQVSEKLRKKSSENFAETNAAAKKQSTRKKSKNETKIEIETDSRVCRICLEGEIESRLISPCSCSGSCALVHLKCLRLWLTESTRETSTDACEICHGAYKLKTVKVNPHFGEFISKYPCVLVDMGIFILLPILIFVVLKCTAARLYDDIVGIGPHFLILVLLCCFFLWICTRLKSWIFLWSKWRVQNQRLKILPIDPENTGNNANTVNSAESISIAISMETETVVNSNSELLIEPNANANTNTNTNTIIQSSLLKTNLY